MLFVVFVTESFCATVSTKPTPNQVTSACTAATTSPACKEANGFKENLDSSVLIKMEFDGTLSISGIPEKKISVEVIGKKPIYIAGISGKALVVRNRNPIQGICLHLPDGFPKTTGSVSLWVCPLDWSVKDKYHHMFLSGDFQKPQQNAKKMEEKKTTFTPFSLYKYAQPHGLGVYWYCRRDIKGNPSGLNHPSSAMGNWKRRSWHHIVMTWDKGQADDQTDSYMALYVDGARSDFRNPASFDFADAVDLFLGAASGGPGQTAVDELILYNRPLSDSEVGALFAETMETYWKRRTQ